MAKSKIKAIIKFLQEALTEQGIEVETIVVFGSQARGAARKDSDLDLLVVSRNFRGKNIFQRAAMLGDADYRTIKKFMVPVDLVTMSPEEWKRGTSLVAQFARTGQVAYQK
jgi:predicted nucleotidyltransferase